MSVQSAEKQPKARIALPDIPALAVNARQAALLTTDGELKTLPHSQAQIVVHERHALVCHAPYTRQLLGAGSDFYGFDVLELFAFVHPARFCVPTPAGLAKTLGLSVPESFEDYPFTLVEIAQALLSDLRDEPRGERGLKPLEIAAVMGLQGKGWVWTPYIFAALGEEYDPAIPPVAKSSLNVWRHLPEWSESAPEPPPAHYPVTGAESRERLQMLLGPDAEARAQQVEYATEVTAAFAPKNEDDQPHVVLAEAGTGTGKTLGYLAPASVWAEKNEGIVWVSTFTKNLQRQISRELDRLYPDPAVKEHKVSIRKGRENYLCLLNFEDTVTGAALAKHPNQAIAAGLMARWAESTGDGDLQGGDFPGWLAGLLGYRHTTALSDRRGECVYSACDHYHKCFVERAIRRANHADIVIANHALVMVKAVIAGPDDPLPPRYVFDEGHHLFEAADSAFAGHLTARETADLRRWLIGAEGGRRSRARGLRRRAEDLIAGNDEAESLLQDIIHTAHMLPGPGWTRRLRDGAPFGATEEFLHMVYAQVHTRANGRDGPYSLETQTFPLIDGLGEKAAKLQERLRDLQRPMRGLSAILKKRLGEQADTLDSDTRKRLESVSGGLDRRSESTIAGWVAMLETLKTEEPSEQHTDWMEIERIDGQAVDLGLYRHWIDPMLPFAKSIAPFAHGMLITSATLRDASGSEEADWAIAEQRTGAHYLSHTSKKASFESPFDYAQATRIFVINDINKNSLDQVASACRELFRAAGGGALGLFTAIQRLRAVHERIALPLEEAGLHLYAQHVDEIDPGTLVDIFRDDLHACLLGTDAMRDGVDVPGEALRLLVYDRVPWPRPTILHKARREAFGGRAYDEMITRFKLRQAFGRLIRSRDDRGVFVMLDSGMPSRLCGAFPEGVEVVRTGLADTIVQIRDFLKL